MSPDRGRLLEVARQDNHLPGDRPIRIPLESTVRDLLPNPIFDHRAVFAKGGEAVARPRLPDSGAFRKRGRSESARPGIGETAWTPVAFRRNLAVRGALSFAKKHAAGRHTRKEAR